MLFRSLVKGDADEVGSKSECLIIKRKSEAKNGERGEADNEDG